MVLAVLAAAAQAAQQPADPAVEWLKIIGSLAGIAALLWRAFDEWRAYLRLSVSVESGDQGWVLISTEVENKGVMPKGIFSALLVIGPESEGPVKTAGALLDERGGGPTLVHTNDLVKIEESIKSTGRAVVMLPFYYIENINVGDETLGYTIPVERKYFEAGKPYSVRFFVFDRFRLHRSTQACFVA